MAADKLYRKRSKKIRGDGGRPRRLNTTLPQTYIDELERMQRASGLDMNGVIIRMMDEARTVKTNLYLEIL